MKSFSLKRLALALALLAPPVSGLMSTSVSAQSPSVSAAAATKLFADVQIDTDCDGAACSKSTLANSNTTRKLAVLADGTIAATFRADSGVYVATSKDRGKTFSKPVKVTSDSREAEIAASAAGVLYVLWNTSVVSGNDTTYTWKISKSTDAGAKWSTPVDVGTVTDTGMGGPPGSTTTPSQPAHMAVDGDYVYVLNQRGSKLFRSADAGATWATTDVDTVRAFSDVQVDPLNGTVYIFTDDPKVRYFTSTDRGVTLSAVKETSVSVYFSVGALTATSTERYFYMAGSNANLERITMSNGTVDTKTVEKSEGMQTRSIAADACGNVVSGHKTGADLFFQVSTDSGSTFGTAEKVVEAADRANTSINTTNGDVLVLYEKSNKIYLTTYTGVFSGNCYAAALSTTAVEFTAPGENKEIVITNSSASPLDISSINISGTVFKIKHNCPAQLAPGATCKITVTGKLAGNETVTLVAGGVTKLIPIKMGAIAEKAAPAKNTGSAGGSGTVDAKLYRKIPKTMGKLTAHTVLGSSAARSRVIVSRTPSVCVGLPTVLVTLATGTCRYQIVDKKSRNVISTHVVSVKADYTGTGTQLTSGGLVMFSEVSWKMSKTALAKTKEIAEAAKDSARVLVVGHAALLTESLVFNRRISEFRAANVKRNLQKYGYKGPISMRVLGSTAPLNTTKTETAQAKNRRVEVLLWPAASN